MLELLRDPSGTSFGREADQQDGGETYGQLRPVLLQPLLLKAGLGMGSYQGGPGDDVIYTSPDETDTADGGGGNDIIYSPGGGNAATWNMDSGEPREYEQLNGGAGDDVVYIGEGFNYVGGDGNWYTGDTAWHSDGFHHVGRYLKIALYLDPVGRDTGCLRV
ncbi:MAG: hypothetical protein M3177_04555, partial [Pseudomonadota bacterium]|nr:hypothetical protein [Pseudomonadota bacterium]